MLSIHNHTEYSNASRGFLDSSNKLKDLIKEAKKIGLSGIAITDHETLSGHYKAQQLGKSLDFPVVLGNEIYLQTPEQYEEAKNNYQSGITTYPHFILLALDEIGHEQLRKLSTRAWYRSYTGGGLIRTPTLTTDIEEIIGSNKGHVVASSGCLGGALGRLILKLINEINTNNNEETINSIKWEIFNFLDWCKNNFGQDNFYIEIQPASEEQVEQKLFNIQAVNIAKAMDIKFVVSTDSHYLNRNQASIHKALLNNKDVEREVDSFYRTAYLMNEEELRDYLENNLDKDDIDTAIFNTMDILSKVKDYNLHRGQIVPVITPPKFHIRHLFKDYYDKYEYIEKFAYADREQDRYLLYQIENAIQKRINVNEWDTYLDRINKEFKEIYLITEEIKEPLSGYYNTMGKIIDLVWTKGDSFVCPGRGSSGAFLICYLLDITQTDPVPLGDLMPLWRHVSADRGHDLPDYDIKYTIKLNFYLV